MQWLIDLIIEAIGIPPTFINRGDPADFDFKVGDFTTDGAWHDLDLSSIVPAGATAVLIRVIVNDNLIAQFMRFRTKGFVNIVNFAGLRTMVANQAFYLDYVIIPDADRVIEYWFSNTVWSNIFVTVGGWWL